MLAHPLILWLIDTDLEAAHGYGTKMSLRYHTLTVVESQHHIIDPTNPGGALDDGIEHRLHVRGRTADDTEHLGSGGLVLQRLAQFCVALLQLVEEPYVLDGNDCLIGKRFEEGDLFVGERTD